MVVLSTHEIAYGQANLADEELHRGLCKPFQPWRLSIDASSNPSARAAVSIEARRGSFDHFHAACGSI